MPMVTTVVMRAPVAPRYCLLRTLWVNSPIRSSTRCTSATLLCPLTVSVEPAGGAALCAEPPGPRSCRPVLRAACGRVAVRCPRRGPGRSASRSDPDQAVVDMEITGIKGQDATTFQVGVEPSAMLKVCHSM